jgi:hypothetical protein
VGRLHEKGGKRHEMPCLQKLEVYLHDYMEPWAEPASIRKLLPNLSRG